MSTDTTCALKMIVFTVITCILTVVSGECPPRCHCTRYKVFCSYANVKTFPTSLPSITELLRIELDYIPQINSTIITNSGLHHLIHLELVNVNLNRIQPGSFRNMSQLQFLSITNNNITVLERNTFRYLENLYFLDLTFNEISNLEPGTFSGLSNLRHLDLGDNFIRIPEANVFEEMTSTVNCDIINILNYLSTINSEILSYLCSFTYFNTDNGDKLLLNNNYIHYGKSVLLISSSESFAIIPIITYKRSNPGSLYLDLTQAGITLTVGSFQNMTQVTQLDISFNHISYIPRGTFIGLISLKLLIMNSNNITSINNGAFHGLNSLKQLEMVGCNINTIESNAFEGLSKLQVLDLSENSIHILKHNAFSGLYMLKHITLGIDDTGIIQIDETDFSGMRNLKSFTTTTTLSQLQNDFYIKILYYEIEKLLYITLPKIKPEVFVNLTRLDTLQCPGHSCWPQDMQVLKSIHLYIDARAGDSQQLSNLQQTLRYVRDLHITLLDVNSTQSFNTLFEVQISSFTLLHSDVKFLNNQNYSKLISITIYKNNTHSILIQTFDGMKSLTYLTIFYDSDFILEDSSFYRHSKLMHLYIQCLPLHCTNKCLTNRTFFYLPNLQILTLEINLTSLNPGVFHGLYNIEAINLNDNNINKIKAGVFGAECQKNFDLTCKNVTLPEYCNNTNALKTLKYLDLSRNNITHIHPHAFIGCNNLQNLYLSSNHFLTLDNSFLFIPALRTLGMAFCNISNIPDNTFICTPLLSEINFRYNTRLNYLSSLHPLKHLQYINVEFTSLLCTCEQYEVWLWMREHHVHYDTSFHYNSNKSDCGGSVDKAFAALDCNITQVQISVAKNITIIRDDFQFFKLYIEPLVLIVILIFGLACNGFLLFISLRHTDMRTKQNTSVIHLATVDVLSLILNLPLSYWQTVNIIWEFDETLCKIFILTKDMMVGVVVSSTVTLAIERYIVAKTFKKIMKVCVSEKLPTTWFLFMTWISGIVTSLPAYFSATVVNGQCLYCPPGNNDYLRNVHTFQLLMYCLAPAVVITFLNIKTSLFLRESVRRIPGEIKNSITTQNRITVANVVLILVLVFVVSYLPNYILRVLVAWSVVDIENLFLPSFFTFCLFFCNTVFNPISLFIMSSKFKSYVLIYFPFLGNEQNP